MDTYSFLREFADSWALLLMTLFFLSVIFWAFRPGSRAVHDEIAQIPFRDDNASGCANDCKNCDCSNTFDIAREEA